MKGHRTYIDNPKLVSTVAHRPPAPKGHRVYLELRPVFRRAA
jgi:hypothetical protein